jgi:AmmeMemoRadiSam system protein B
MPSPLEEQPGLLIRDPFRYSDSIIVVPPPLVPFLAFFDGANSLADLKLGLVRASGDLRAAELAPSLVQSLSANGFLDDEAFRGLKEAKEEAFRVDPVRRACHAGSAYPVEAGALRATLEGYLASGEAPTCPPGLAGIAAPHVSPEGGPGSYACAYSLIDPSLRDRTFVILGTSHYGEPGRFGLTRKPFETPLGRALADEDAVETLARAAPKGVVRDDYCFAIEHSIEFQVIFLQHRLPGDLRILPVLCGPLFRNGEGVPEADEGVGGFIEALAALVRDDPGRFFFVLGVDMAHMGRRYGDPFAATAGTGEMAGVEGDDRARLRAIEAGDADAFWGLLGDGADPLKWCGTSPLYTLLRAVPGLEGRLLRYDQWNIDRASVVSFGAIAFFRPGLQ